MPRNGNGAIHLAQGLGSDKEVDRIAKAVAKDRAVPTIYNANGWPAPLHDVKAIVRGVLEHAETR